MEELTAELKSTKKQGAPVGTILIIFAVVVLLAGATGLGVYMYIKGNPQVLGLDQNGGKSDEEMLIEKVAQLVILPEGETPAIKTIDDLEHYADQAFFGNAQVGDKILIYNEAKKIYLYRPSDNRLVEVGVLSGSDDSGEATVSGETVQEPTAKKVTPTPTRAPLVTKIPSKTPTPTVTPTPDSLNQ